MKTLFELQAELKKLEEESQDLDCEIAGMEDRIGELEFQQDKVETKISDIKNQIAALTPEETEADKEVERQKQLLKQRYGYIPQGINDWWQS